MSKVIHNPALAKIIDNSENSSTFVIEPLHFNYGNTLGNSLRRVLLSSIRGGAIVAFRIEGATHEFTTVPGIQEDVVDITLNLKGVNFRIATDEKVSPFAVVKRTALPMIVAGLTNLIITFIYL